MVKLNHSIIIERKPEQIFSVLADFVNYPKFLPQMKAVKILQEQPSEITAHFTIELLEHVSATFRFQLQKPTQLTWQLVESEALKENSGSWQLLEIEPGVCEVTYNTELDLKIFVPDLVLQGLMKLHLPSMLKAMQQEVEKRYA